MDKLLKQLNDYQEAKQRLDKAKENIEADAIIKSQELQEKSDKKLKAVYNNVKLEAIEKEYFKTFRNTCRFQCPGIMDKDGKQAEKVRVIDYNHEDTKPYKEALIGKDITLGKIFVNKDAKNIVAELKDVEVSVNKYQKMKTLIVSIKCLEAVDVEQTVEQ